MPSSYAFEFMKAVKARRGEDTHENVYGVLCGDESCKMNLTGSERLKKILLTYKNFSIDKDGFITIIKRKPL